MPFQGFFYSLNGEEFRQFWYLVALIEIGALDYVKKIVENHKFTNTYLPVALHLGSFFYSRRRAITNERKSDAKAICKALDPYLKIHDRQIVRELKAQMAELRRGGIVALDDQSEGKS